jgi:SAM-dependent methyltransferase
MPPTILSGDIYDYPKYYDLIFGSDWREEYDFLKKVFDKHSDRPVKRLFEPACGTGRFFDKFAADGYEISGLDLNDRAVNFCNERLKRKGFPESAYVGDMTDFKVKKKFDAGFNMINSFRHLYPEAMAVKHMECMAEAVYKGGLYVMGLHLNPEDFNLDDYEVEEAWSARRGNLSVNTSMWSISYDKKTRREEIGFAYDIYTPTEHKRIEDTLTFMCYTAKQYLSLLKKVPQWELVETYDFAYDIDDPIKVNKETQDVVYVLKRV